MSNKVVKDQGSEERGRVKLNCLNPPLLIELAKSPNMKIP
jgi:hypothetical protein